MTETENIDILDFLLFQESTFVQKCLNKCKRCIFVFEFSVVDERNRNNPDMLLKLSDTEVLY